jgi:UDP-N-acetylmuramoyl-tripeptide--D-alanyl-D-alanine ligase
VPRLDAEFVQNALRAELSGALPAEAFAEVSTDSRTLSDGELFVAIKGPNFDGHDFVEQALDGGAAAALVSRDFNPPPGNGACLLRVEDTTRALGDLAAAWRKEHSALVIAVTGSNGKTTTKEMLASILAQRHRVLKNQGNFNNHIGLPLTLLQLTAEHTVAVLEMGMSAVGEIARLTEIAAPEVGLVTNVGPAHLEFFGSVEAIAAAKAELYQGLSPAATAVINQDDPLLAPWAKQLGCRILTFGFSPGADVRGRDLASVGSRLELTLEPPSGDPVHIGLGLPGRHNAHNALAAAAGAWALGQGPEAIKAGLEAMRPLKGRLASQPAPGGYTVVDDTYNANPISVAGGLEALKAMAGPQGMILILGDMLELGPEASRLHREAGLLAAKAGCRAVLSLGRFADEVAQGAQEGGIDPRLALGFEDLQELLRQARTLLQASDVVLVKGSRGSRMERVADALMAGEADYAV